MVGLNRLFLQAHSSSSAAAVLTAIAVTSLSLGFWVGSKRARVQATEPGKPPAPTAATQGGVNGLQGSEGSDEEDSDSEGEDEHVSNLKVDPEDDCKMVRVRVVPRIRSATKPR